MLITKPEHGDFDFDEGRQGQVKGGLSLNLNRFQTKGTYDDFDSYDKVWQKIVIMISQCDSITEAGDKHIGRSQQQHWQQHIK